LITSLAVSWFNPGEQAVIVAVPARIVGNPLQAGARI
jgi:hypothetical protein